MSRSVPLALLAVLLFTLCGGTSAPPGTLALHPSLYALATLHPAQTVSVIVQKATSDDHLEKAVAAQGGRVTSDLWIINGFGAELPASALLQLAAAGGVRWISPDGLVQETGGGIKGSTPAELANHFVKTIGAEKSWHARNPDTGQGIGVAVMDSGITQVDDFNNLNQVSAGAAGVSFNEKDKTLADDYGHGTHVGGIISGNGTDSNGAYMGVAPGATLYSLKIADMNGQGTTAGVLQASEWLLTNHAKYNIRVVNMSFSSGVSQSYHVDPIDAVVELLWQNGVVVVASVGNTGPNGAITAPGNDPYAIAVGATDDKGTDNPADDSLAAFSSYGTIENGISKPDLVAPGRHIISVLADKHASLVTQHSPNIVDKYYFMMSGTSMASPMVAGTVALLLRAQPGLTPNQVKGCLMENAGKAPAGSNAKYLKADDVAGWNCSQTIANQAVTPSKLAVQISAQLIPGGSKPGMVSWGNVNWGNVNWGNVNWGNVNWGNVNWGAVSDN